MMTIGGQEIPEACIDQVTGMCMNMELKGGPPQYFILLLHSNLNPKCNKGNRMHTLVLICPLKVRVF